MDLETRPVGPVEREWLANQRKWTRGWRSVVFPGVFLVYLAQVGAGVAQYSRGGDAVLGYVVLAMFCVLYLLTLPEAWNTSSRRFWPFYGGLIALCALELPLLGRTRS